MSNETKWTRGPWVGPLMPFDSAPWLQIYCSDGKGIMHRSRSDDEKIANACLGAAGPEMYDALSCLSDVYSGIYVKMSDEEMAMCREAWANADAAMAKARGEA